MSLLVQKFGGSSVADITCIERVADRVIATKEQGHQVVVVVSAMAGDTNKLVALAKQITEDPDMREYDVLLSSGEMITIALLSIMLNKKGYQARSYTANQIKILTDDVHKKAHVVAVETARLLEDLTNGWIPVVAGFQGVNEKGDITTLGRGGSDATAVALAAALNANECQIYTDVDGVYTADPRIVKEPRMLSKISYDEMLQMASLGAKVLQTQSVELACQNNVPTRVKSTFTNNPGTLLCHHVERLKATPVTGVVSKHDLARITLRNVPHYAGFVVKVLAVLTSRHISIDMMVQHQSEDNQSALSIVVPRDEFVLAETLLTKFVEEQGLPSIIASQGVAKLSLVGHGLNSHAQVLHKMFEVLAAHQIDIFMLTCTEIKISVIVNEELLEIGVEALHNAFELSHEQSSH
ncbi:MAG: aspartate kinase [Gammaproteobacteria bacterium RIFCSPHIGHO2_12_FULL_35_23]|nr:MAG: aspartate kinase [Gammaproteobacteria bacterium RIFCSPHIGHO2_12_FULL_35_23]